MFLTATELRELTGRTQKGAQAEALRQMGIEHKMRPDGTVAVLRAHVERSLGLHETVQNRRTIEPNWNAL